jgi:hypothetical protein
VSVAEHKKIQSPIEFHAVRNVDGTFRVSVLSEVHNRMGADKKKDLGKQETVIQNCNFTATVYGEHSIVEIGEKRG